MLWQGVLPIVPFVIFAFAGFEAAASLSRHIKNPDKNAPLAVLISFAIVVFICVISNFIFFMVLGDEIKNAGSYFQAFPLLLNKVFPTQEFLRLRLTALLQLAIGCSALGGAYGILFSNSWNLYALAENKHIFFVSAFSRLNKFNIPILCVLSEAFICLFYLLLTQGNNVPLQQIAAFGNLSAFTISALSLFWSSINKKSNYFWLGLIATANCFGLLIICIRQTFISGGIHFLIFLSLLLMGILMFWYNKD
jgi:amino acid transporter